MRAPPGDFWCSGLQDVGLGGRSSLATSQERLALGVVALLLAAGAGVRFVGSEPGSAELVGIQAVEGSAAAEGGGLGERVQEEVARARRRSLPLAPGERIDPNSADADELQRLPRVGPALAARIIARRETHGPFRTLADLDAVPGIGPVLLEGITPLVDLPPAPPPLPAAARSERQLAPAGPAAPVAAPLDLNRATAEELVRLPGIGPVLAARIVESRRTQGPFRSVEDLQRVSGIGPKVLERIAPLVRVGP